GGGVGVGPGDFDGVDGFIRAHIDDDPLGVEGIVIAGEMAGEVGVALPVDGGAANGGIAAGGKAAMGEGVRQDVSNGFFEIGAGGEIAALMGRIAPGAAVVPVPGGHAEFAVVAIGNGAPSGGEAFLDDVGGVDLVDAVVGKDVD